MGRNRWRWCAITVVLIIGCRWTCRKHAAPRGGHRYWWRHCRARGMGLVQSCRVKYATRKTVSTNATGQSLRQMSNLNMYGSPRLANSRAVRGSICQEQNRALVGGSQFAKTTNRTPAVCGTVVNTLPVPRLQIDTGWTYQPFHPWLSSTKNHPLSLAV